MKKVLGVLVVLLMASPAMAAVNITGIDAGDGWGEISYNAAGEPNLPRAFAMKIEITVGSATIDGVQFAAGTGDDACATCEDFKIHPGNIQIDGKGNVVSWGKPVAPGNAPDNPPQLPSTTYIIIEMGSLYQKGVDPPPAPSGLLIRVRVTASCTMTVSEEATVRGGIVMEDADPPDGGHNLPIYFDIVKGCATCLGDCNGDTWVTSADNAPFWAALREARDDSESPIYTGGMYFECPAGGSYDCFDVNEDGWVTSADNAPFWANLREARDDPESPIYTGGMYYECP